MNDRLVGRPQRDVRHASLFGAVIVAILLPAPVAAQPPSVDEVVARATRFVADYEAALGSLIAEERYEQRMPVELAGFAGGRLSGGRLAAGRQFPRFTGGAAVDRVERRMRSDFLMIRLPAAGDQWVGLRVALEVDGRPVHDGVERVRDALRDSSESSLAQWHTMAEESARFNLSTVIRTTNVPTFALLIFHPEHRERFTFERVGTDRIDGLDVWVLRFREVDGPTLIRDPARAVDVPVHGRVWLDPDAGRIVRTELRTGDERSGTLRSEVVVRYRPDATLGEWVPRDMREKYEDRRGPVFEARARYSDYQRFGVSTDARVGEAPAAAR